MSEHAVTVARRPQNVAMQHMIQMAIHDIRRPYLKMITDLTAYRTPKMIVGNGMIVNQWDDATQSAIDTITQQAEEAVKCYLRQQHLL
jgi:hypothetical protein